MIHLQRSICRWYICRRSICRWSICRRSICRWSICRWSVGDLHVRSVKQNIRCIYVRDTGSRIPIPSPPKRLIGLGVRALGLSKVCPKIGAPFYFHFRCHIYQATFSFIFSFYPTCCLRPYFVRSHSYTKSSRNSDPGSPSGLFPLRCLPWILSREDFQHFLSSPADSYRTRLQCKGSLVLLPQYRPGPLKKNKLTRSSALKTKTRKKERRLSAYLSSAPKLLVISWSLRVAGLS